VVADAAFSASAVPQSSQKADEDSFSALHFGQRLDKGLPQAAQQACASILQSLNLHPGQRADPARIAALTRFAQCIRQHGLADFPDPDPSGNFPTNSDPALQPGWAAAFQACSSLMPKTKG